MDQQFVVSSSPFIHSKNDLNRLFLYTALVLIFPIIYGIYLFGFRSLIMIGVSVASCALFEALYNLYDIKKFKLNNISFLITGIILALSFPVNVPLFIIAISAFIATVIVKMSFGGIGRNYFNPACTARCLAGIMLPGLSASLYETNISGDVYFSEYTLLGDTEITLGTGEKISHNILQNLMSGKAVGNIGTTCIIVLLLCMVCLIYLRIIEAKLPILAIVSFVVVSLLTHHDLDTTALHLCSGSFIFVAVFIITDPNTSPNTFFGKLVYSIAYGTLCALVWNLGDKAAFLGENSAFVVALFVNLLTPFMDKYLINRPSTIGGYRNAYKN